MLVGEIYIYIPPTVWSLKTCADSAPSATNNTLRAAIARRANANVWATTPFSSNNQVPPLSSLLPAPLPRPVVLLRPPTRTALSLCCFLEATLPSPICPTTPPSLLESAPPALRNNLTTLMLPSIPLSRVWHRPPAWEPQEYNIHQHQVCQISTGTPRKRSRAPAPSRTRGLA